MEVENDKIVVVILMVVAFGIRIIIDKTTWYGQILSWVATGTLICCALYEINNWNNKRKEKKNEM